MPAPTSPASWTHAVSRHPQPTLRGQPLISLSTCRCLADTTFLLTHFARDREICGCGETLPLEFAVKKLTSDNCDLYHLRDRGAVQVIPHVPSQFLLNSSPILTRGLCRLG